MECEIKNLNKEEENGLEGKSSWKLEKRWKPSWTQSGRISGIGPKILNHEWSKFLLQKVLSHANMWSW